MEGRKIKILLLLIIILSFFLRFYKLTTIPASLNPDEHYNGYLAYSLLTTGKDLWGNYFPLAIKTFGSWTLPAYPYLTMIPVAIFGLTDFSARLVGALFGIAGSVAIFYLADELFKKKKVALIAALLFALSPWSLFMSRISHEVNVAAVFFMFGLLALLKKKYSWAAIVFGLTMFTHYAFVIFTPLFLGAWSALGGFESWKDKKFLVGSVIFGIFLFVSAFTTITGSAKEVNDVGFFNNKDILYNRVERFLSEHDPTDFLKVIHNRYIGMGYQVAQNYVADFSPSFLFDIGGQKLLHNTGYTGNLYLFDFFFILIGVAGMAWQREKNLKLLAIWFFLAPIPSIFTKDNPSSTRLFQMVPLFMILSSYGLYTLAKMFKSKIWFLGLCLVVFGCSLYFFDLYFVHVNDQRARFYFYGYKEAALIAQKYPDKKIEMVGPDNFPFITFLFYNKYNPNKFRSEVQYYPEQGNGFQFVKSFGNYSFPWTIDRATQDSNSIYFDNYRNGDEPTINLPSGEPIFSYFVR